MVSIKRGIKLSQMLRGGCRSGDMQCEGGIGNAKCISGLFMGALGAVEGNAWAVVSTVGELLPRLYALMNLPLKKRDIRDRTLPSLEDTSLSLASWKT